MYEPVPFSKPDNLHFSFHLKSGFTFFTWPNNTQIKDIVMSMTLAFTGYKKNVFNLSWMEGSDCQMFLS